MSESAGRGAGRVCTVAGFVEPHELGIVLPHEHVFVDARPLRIPPPPYAPKDIATLEVRPTTMSDIAYFPYSHLGNLVCSAADEAEAELGFFKAAGGGTLVDVTTRGIGVGDGGTRPAERLAALATATGVHIVAGAGFYVAPTHPEMVVQQSVDELAQHIAAECLSGIDGSGIPAGLIGEIGCSTDLDEKEIKVLQAAAKAQRITGRSLMVHPGRKEGSPMEIVDVLRAAGADLSRVVIAHLDRTIFESENLLALAATGVYLELDLWGQEVSFYQQNENTHMRSDEERIAMVKLLCESGYADRVLLSHDIHTRHRMQSCGGHGFSHLLTRIPPRLRTRGIKEEHIKLMFETNPQAMLTIQ